MVSILLARSANAQTQTGNGLISGATGVAHYQSKAGPVTYSQSGWQPNLNLTAGRFVADGWLLGLSVAGQTSFRESTARIVDGFRPVPLRARNQEVLVTTTPFVRRYFRFNPVYVFAGAGVSVGVLGSNQREQTFDYQTNQLTTNRQRSHSFSVNPYLEAGVNYFLTKRLALQLTATANSLPFGVAGFNTGLTYWTGPDRKNAAPEARDNPQTNRGNWLVEGGFSVNRAGYRQTGNEVGASSFNTYGISPAVGYFIGKNNLIGLSFPVTFVSNQSAGVAANRADTWSVGIAPYYQRYFTSTRLTPYVEASITYLMSGNRGDNETARNVTGNVGLGLAYMVGQRFIVETSLANAQFTYYVPVESLPDARAWSAGLSAGLRGNFSVRYVLTRAK